MADKNPRSGKQFLAALHAIGAVITDALTTAGSFDACCGITLGRDGRADDMPTPSSCCGVRV